VVCINPPREVLFDRINGRVDEMLAAGWIEEAENLMRTPWQEFIATKGFIGYPELFAWITCGKQPSELPALIASIQKQTRVYAKRQVMFWKRLVNMLNQETDRPQILEFKNHECAESLKGLAPF
jgi:tRNA dimethylallyltransferase